MAQVVLDAVSRAHQEMISPGVILGKNFGPNKCLIAVRTLFGLSSDGNEPTAYASWLDAGGANGANTHTVLAPVANVPFYMKSRSVDGHIVVSAGSGWCYTTDFNGKHWVDDGRIYYVTIASLEATGELGLGWSEVLEGVRVHPHVTS